MSLIRRFPEFCLVLSGLLLVQVKLARAQERTDPAEHLTTGVFIYPSVSLTAWTTDEFNISQENGGGGGIGFGYGITNGFSVFVNATGGTLKQTGTGDTYSLAHLDLGARMTLGSLVSPWKYIFDVTVSGISMENAFPKPEIELEGRMYSLGVGVQNFVKGPIALQAYLTAGWGIFNDYRIDGEEVDLTTIDRSFRTSRFSLSIIWFAMQ